MIITLEQMQEAFKLINEACYGNTLPEIPLRVVKENRKSKGPAYCETYDSYLGARISICNKYNKPPYEYSLHHLMIHEMLHLHLYIRDQAHLVGPGWCTKRKAMKDHRFNGNDWIAAHTREFFQIEKEQNKLLELHLKREANAKRHREDLAAQVREDDAVQQVAVGG